MRVIVTCGPSYEPIDQVRRLTNFSTGEPGVHLSNHLARAGFEVFCLKGSGATHPGPGEQCHLSLFSTNDDLLELLEQTSETREIAAVFHVVALCDYKVRRVENAYGQDCDSPKIASRSGALTIHLEPATKVISHLRELFPRSIVVGWKYELAGTRADAVGKAERQIAENCTHGCVVNGRAFGSGFGFCRPGQRLRERETKPELVRFLVEWIQEMVPDCPDDECVSMCANAHSSNEE